MIEQSAKLNTTVTHVFEYTQLEKLIKELYGTDIDILHGGFISDDRIGHYTYHEWTVDGESELFDIDDDKIVAAWIETGEITDLDIGVSGDYWRSTFHVNLDHIMHRLYIDGHIPAGNYLMKVDW